MNVDFITKEVDWFCLHATQMKLLRKEDCVAIIEAIEQNKEVLESAGVGDIDQLDLFIQVMKDNDMCSSNDDATIQRLRKNSREEARLFGFPSKGVFTDDKTAEERQEIHEKHFSFPKLNMAGQAVESKADAVKGNPWASKPEEMELPEGEIVELTGWPNLGQAESMSEDAVRGLMADFLRYARRANCSDVHISTGSRPFVRRYQAIYHLDDQPVLTEEMALRLNMSILTDAQRQAFKENQDLDFCYAVSERERYRGNVLCHNQGISGAYRIVSDRVRTIRELGFLNPEVIEKLTTYTQGLILLTGPSGCGKTTTMNAMINFINQTRHDHIITMEDPIENVIPPINCNVTQRQLGDHTVSYGSALRAALREDPDIIAIGEMRDMETIEMAIRSAETGHLVFGTLHTSSAAATIDRILDVFPANQQSQIRSMVSESIRGIICQRMYPNADNTGLVMASEVMLGTLAVGNLIRDGKTHQLNSSIQIGRKLGMCTMEQCLFELYMAGKRSFEQTKKLVTSPDLVRQMQAREAEKLRDSMPADMRIPKRRKFF